MNHFRNTMTRSGLARNPSRAAFFGVCAGLARWMGVDLKVLRICTVIAALFYPVVIAVYVVAALVLDKRPETVAQPVAAGPYTNQPAADAPPPPPAPSAGEVNEEFDQIERKLRGLEAYLSTKEFELDREFRKLDQPAS